MDLVSVFLSVVVLSSSTVAVSSDPNHNLVSVGVAKVDITPKYAVRLSGYGNRREESEGIEQTIWAKALAIGSDSDGPVVLITVDNCGVPSAVTKEVASRLKRRAGIRRECVAICSSHTHSAPMLTGVLPLLFGMPIPKTHQQHIDQYTRELTDWLEQVALAALAARHPCRLGWAVGQVGFANNRRRQGGPVDHSLPVLCVRDADNSLCAVLVRYACHCTTLGGEFNRIGGDWTGYAQEAVERDHPGAIALVTIGCGADSNPQPRRELRFAREHGEEIAREVNRLLAGKFTPIEGSPRARCEQIELPFGPLPTKEEWQKRAQSRHQATAYHAQIQLQRLERGETLPTVLPYSVQTWTFRDDLAMVFLAGEVVGDYAVRLGHEFDASRLWITAYANDVPCYIPSRRLLREGGYEPVQSMIYYDRPAPFDPIIEDRIVDTVQRLLPHEFYSKDKQVEYPPHLSPAKSLAAFRPRPGLEVELVAAEPLVIDPVWIDFGIDGRLWVVEYLDYPTGLHGAYQPGGRIKYLTDTDADGRYDTATVFLDNVPFPMGVMEWRDGVLVAAAPDVLYARDTNGDGRADVRKTLFTGFGTDNYQARVNGFRYGLDNWVYGSSGLRGGKIRSLLTGKTVDVGHRDFRFHPDTGALETVAGGCQYGRVSDNWGHWFGNTNSSLLFHYPMPEHYVRRNRYVAAPRPSVLVPTGGEQAHRVFPASHTLLRFNNPQHYNRITSACSPEVYRDDLLGPEIAGDAFVCEPVHNLVTRLKLEPHGSTFAGQRVDDEQQSEFLASTDNWFRPAQVRTGPDGALWVVDMYRFVIEHPRWIGPDRLAKLDVRAGDHMGRIYRVYPKGKRPRPIRNLGRLSASALAEAIDSPNGPVRDLIQRELVHRQDRAAVNPLEAVVRHGKRPEARLQALCTLDGLQAVSPKLLLAALADHHPQVRCHAIRLSEPWLDQNRGTADSSTAVRTGSASKRAVRTQHSHSSRLQAQVLDAVLRQANTDDASIRYQLAFSLGATSDARAGRILGQIARRDAKDVYVVAAVLSSSIPHLEQVVTTLLEDTERQPPPETILEKLVQVALAVHDEQTLADVLDRLGRATDSGYARWQYDTLAGLLDRLDRRKTSLTRLREHASDPLRTAIDNLTPLFQTARQTILDDTASEAIRKSAARLLGRGLDQSEEDLEHLAQLLEPQQPPDIQLAAVVCLSHLTDATVPQLLLNGWRRHAPHVRSEILNILLSRTTWLDVLLDAMEDGTVSPADMDLSHRNQLLQHAEPRIRNRAQALLATSLNANRQHVIEAYQSALSQTGHADRGRERFTKICANCHRFQGSGNTVGPSLETLTDPSPQGVLISILDPNRAVDPRYLEYITATVDGRVLHGRLMNETATSITLLGPEDKQQVVLRSDVEELVSSGKSMMPEGLEQDLTPEDIADIMAYLRSAGPQRKLFSGNEPEVVRADAKNTFSLLPKNAEVYGRTLAFGKVKNVSVLTQWRSPDDQAVWKLDVDRPGRYQVWLDWMCDEGSIGNQFVLEVTSSSASAQSTGRQDSTTDPNTTLTGTTTDTVSESNWFRTRRIGEIDLEAGSTQVVLRAAGSLSGSLFQLRALTILPIQQ